LLSMLLLSKKKSDHLPTPPHTKKKSHFTFFHANRL